MGISGELLPASDKQPAFRGVAVIDQTVWENIVLDIAAGIPVYLAVAKNGVSSRTFYRDIVFDSEREKQYARAKQVMCNAMSDRINEVAETPLVGERRKTVEVDGLDAEGNKIRLPAAEITIGDNVERSKLMVDAMKWSLAKLMPKVYGDRTEQVHNLGDETIAAMERASARVIADRSKS